MRVPHTSYVLSNDRNARKQNGALLISRKVSGFFFALANCNQVTQDPHTHTHILFIK